MKRSAPGRRPAIVRQRAFAAGFLVAGLLLFTWPFVRVPPLPLAPAFLHLLGAWVLVVAGLAATSRALRRAGNGRDEGGGA
jgi:hypothetical protein